jgi:hypothetical protein
MSSASSKSGSTISMSALALVGGPAVAGAVGRAHADIVTTAVR